MIDALLARMRLGRRVILGFGGLLLLALAIGAGVLIQMDRLDCRTHTSYDQPFALAELTLRAGQAVEPMRRLTRDAVVEGDAARRTAIHREHDRLEGDLGQQSQALHEVARDPRRVDEIVATATAWRAWRDETLRIAEPGDQPAAYRRLLHESGSPVYDLVVQLDQPLAQEQRLSGATAWGAA